MFIGEKKLSNTNLVVSRHIKREKASLPVDVRRSKTSLLKLPLFGVVDDTTTTKFTSRACTVQCNSLPVVVDQAVVVVLKFPIIYSVSFVPSRRLIEILKNVCSVTA